MLDICKLLFGKAQISTGIKYNNSRNFILTSTYKSCKIFFVVRQAQLAQLVEQRTENPCVSGSIPELGIIQQIKYSYAGVVQW